MKKDKDPRKGSTTIGESIQDLLRTYQLKGKYDQMHLVQHWPDLVGKTIASRTGKIYFKNQILVVEITSAPLRNELSNTRQNLLKLIWEKYSKDLVEDVLFV